jgi:hypothetical protein
MTDEVTAAPSGGETQAAPEAAPAQEWSSAREAAAFLSRERWKKAQAEKPAEEPAPEEPATDEPTQPEEQPEQPAAETTPEPEPEEPKPVEIPEPVKKRLAELETIEKQYRQRPQEIEAANAARAQYEQALPALMSMLEQQGQEFADIKTVADIAKLAENDPHRYLKFDAFQKSRAAVHEQIRAVQAKEAEEVTKRWEKFSAEQDEKFLGKFPEFKDKAKAEKATAAALNTLRDAGFEQDELTDLWNGKSGISMRDARLQEIMFKAARYDEAQRAAKQATAKPLPPVIKPGVSQPKGGDTAQVKALSAELDQKGDWKTAARLLIAKRSRSA